MANENRLIDAIGYCKELYEEMNYPGRSEEFMMAIDVAIADLSDAPTVDAVEVVHGKWIHTAIEDDDWGGTFHSWTCSNCDFSTGQNPNGTNYCPNCGARMDLEVYDE